jgi:hypothetical protein
MSEPAFACSLRLTIRKKSESAPKTRSQALYTTKNQDTRVIDPEPCVCSCTLRVTGGLRSIGQKLSFSHSFDFIQNLVRFTRRARFVLERIVICVEGARCKFRIFECVIRTNELYSNVHPNLGSCTAKVARCSLLSSFS